MRFTAVAILASAGFAAAQTSSAAAAQSSCQAQNIVEACTAGIQTQIDACTANDWVCLCNNYTNLLTCYNNCPNDPTRSSVENQVTSYCNAAAPLMSASKASAATASTVAAQASQSSAESATTTQSSSKTSSTASAASASATGAAGNMVAPIGGAIAVFLGFVGML